MISIFDNLVAVIISSIVVITLLSVQMRAQSSTIERSMMYSAKKQTLSVAEILERDLSNAGYNRNPRHQFRIRAYSGGSTSEMTDTNTDLDVTKTFEFWGGHRDSPDDELMESRPIRYRLEPAGTTILQGVKMGLFQLRREVCTSPPANPASKSGSGSPDPCQGSWKPDGASAPTLTRFRIELIDSDGEAIPDSAPLTALDDGVRSLRVWVYNAVAPQVDADMRYLDGHRQLFWRTELTPGGLRGSDGSSSS